MNAQAPMDCNTNILSLWIKVRFVGTVDILFISEKKTKTICFNMLSPSSGENCCLKIESPKGNLV